MTAAPTSTDPCIWAIVLGYNNPDDTIECLLSIQQTTYANFRLLYVDNGSAAGTCEKVMAAVDARCGIVKLEPNAGVAGGFNAGINFAYQQGADYVIIFNNDTTCDPGLVAGLAAAARENPEAGLLVPKIFYYKHPDTIWSAGSVFRKFPPVVYMRKTRGPDDGRHDRTTTIDYATFCVIMFSRRMLEAAGLMDPDYHFLYEDYDLCIRAREAGFGIVFVPAAKAWHKISQTTGANTRNPKFWHTYGRSESIFRRKFRRYRWLTGWTHAIYIVARFVYEGNWYGVKPYIQGWRQGCRDPIQPPPRLGDPARVSVHPVRPPA